MKIHIVGGPGSGKTFLAEKLSRELGIPHYDLDDIQWANEGDYGKKRDTAERDALLNGTAKAEKPMVIILNEAMNGFFSQCELMPFNPDAWRHDKRSVSHCVQELEAWCKRMREAVESSTMVIDGAGSGVHIE